MITIDTGDLQRALRIARMTAKCDCQEKGGDVENHFATIICNEHDRMSDEVSNLKKEDKRSFFSGVAVSLQAVAFFGDSVIAEEIVRGLGGDQDEFYKYLRSEGGVDLDTYHYLIKENTADIVSTLEVIECDCGCDITREVMSSEDGSFDCECGAEIYWRGRNDN